MNLLKEVSRTELEKSDCSGLSMIPLPVFEKNSASINMVRRKNSSKESVAQYIRLKVSYSESHSFALTVDKSICFEKLACMIEAEYYFLYSELIPCCMILSEDWIPLHWDWIIGHHLATGSVVNIVDYTKEYKTDFGLSRLNLEVNSDEKLSEVLIRIFQDPLLESKYYDFLKVNSSLENLFFVLDLNALRKKSVSAEIYRVYLALVYILPNAPLSLNVDSEVKAKIISTLTGGKGVDPSIYDDAFHEAYWSLKFVTDSFLKKNHPLGTLNPVKNGSFRLNLKDTISIMELILTDSNVTFKKITEKTISGFLASATVLDKLAIDRHQILSKVQGRFFENKKDIDTYFYDNTLDKVTLVDKNYKLKKKFGERPSQKDLLRQIPTSVIFKSTENSDDISEDEEDTRAIMVRKSNRLNSFFGETIAANLIKRQVTEDAKKQSDDLEKIRYKWDKLQSVLGEKLPLKYKISQRPTNSEPQDELFYIYQSTLQIMNNSIEDMAQLIDILHTFSSLDLRRDKAADPIPKRRISLEVAVDKGFQTERKVIKLENLLGVDIGVTSLLRQVKNQIISDIETLITNDITDQSQKEILEIEIEKTRAHIDSKIVDISTSCKIVEQEI